MASILEIITRGRNDTQTMWDEVRSGADAVKRGMKEVGTEVDKSGKSWEMNAASVGKWAAGFVTAQAVMGGVQKAFGLVVDFVKGSIKEFSEAEQGQAQLTRALRNQGTATPAVLAQYEKLAKATQDQTGLTGGLVTESQKILAQFGIYPSKMNGAIQASADLARAQGIDLTQAATAVGKAMNGQTGTLERFGIQLSDVEVQAGGADAVLRAINATVGGAGAAHMETYAGKVESLGNAWADLQEEVGGSILQDPLVQRLINGNINNMKLLAGATKDQGYATSSLAEVTKEFALGAGTTRMLVQLRAWADRANEVVKAQRMIANLPAPSLELPRVANITAEALDRVNDELDATEDKQKKAKQAAEDHAKALDGIRETLTGKGAISSMNDWVRLAQESGGLMRLSKDAQEAYNKQLETGVGYLLAAGRAVPQQAFLDWLNTTKALQPEVNKNLGDMVDKLTTIQALAPPAAVSLANTLGPLKDGLQGMPALFDAKLLTPAQAFNNDLLSMAKDNAGKLADLGKEIGSTIGGWFGGVMDQAMGLLNTLVARAKDGSSGLAGFFSSARGQNVVGGIGLGMQTFGQGYQLGGLSSNRAIGTGIGAGSGAATGAIIGTYVMPGLGTAAGAGIGAIAGAIGGWLGSNKKKKEEEAALKELQGQLLETFKGMDNLKKVAAEVGINIDKAFDMKDRKGAIKTIEAFSAALDQKNLRLEAVALAQQIVTDKAALFANGLKDATAITEENQAAFDRLGRQFVTTFQAGIRETGDFFGTMNQLGPGLDQLAELQAKLGFKSSETLGRLLGFRDVVNTNADVGQSIAMNTGLMEAYKAAGMLTRDTLLDFASDAIANYKTLTDRNVDANTAMVMQQKELQLLWEAQQKYGSITDEATLALLKQAEAAGIVGEENRSHNDRMLETMIGIKTAVKELAQVFARELPDSVRAGAEAIDEQFRNRKYTVPVEFEYPDGTQPENPGQGNPNGYAVGGTVPFTPGGRIVRVAEAGTEHIMSRDQVAEITARVVSMMGDAIGGGGVVHIHNEIGGRALGSFVVDTANRGLRNGTVRVPARQVHEQVF